MKRSDHQAPYVHSIEASARLIDQSVRTVYKLVASGELKSILIGKRRVIRDEEIKALLARKERESNKA